MTERPQANAENAPAERLIDDVDPMPVERTGDNSPVGSVWRYVWRMGGTHQICVGMLAIIVAILDLLPIELQRRIVDGALMNQSYEMLFLYGGIYLGVAVLHQVLKFGMKMYQGWIAESTIRYSRRHLMEIYGARCGKDGADSGDAVAIITNEIDKLGGFVGNGVVQAATNVAMLAGATIYMLVVEPQIAIFGLAFMVPQILLTPLLQRKLNKLVEVRVEYMREIAGVVSDKQRVRDEESTKVVFKIYRNRMRYFFVKFGMKALLNLLNASSPLTVLIYGGYLVVEGHTTVGVIVAFLSGFQRVSSPVRALIAVYRMAAQAGVQHEKIADWMNGDVDRKRPAN